MIQRSIAQITTPSSHPGFLGKGHVAAAVIDGRSFMETDPFILLMDDRLDLPGGQPVGGPHPHAGFETVTLVLKGNEKDWKTGSMELMTAGKGVVHTEEITAETKMRILQLWLVLPPEKRWTAPFLQQILLEDVPTKRTDDSEIRVYSGTSQGLSSPLRNQTPVTIVDFLLKKNATVRQEMPAGYNGFIYVIEGSVRVGDATVRQGQRAWLDKPTTSEASELFLRAMEEGVRLLFYAGEPQHASIVSHGPFIGDSAADIARLYQEYREGKMPHVNTLPDDRLLLSSKFKIQNSKLSGF